MLILVTSLRSLRQETFEDTKGVIRCQIIIEDGQSLQRLKEKKPTNNGRPNAITLY